MNSSGAGFPLAQDLNRAPTLNSVIWILCCISIVFVCSRIFTRVTITHNIGWDDWSICASLIFTIAFSVFVSLYAASGGGHHVFFLDEIEIQQATKYSWITQSFAILTVAISKASVALLILRLLGPSKGRKAFLYAVSVLSLLVGSLALILVWIQCQPFWTLWIPTAGTCWDLTAVNHYDLFVSSFFAFTDFALALLPISIVWKLQLDLRKRVLLSMLLGMGIFAFACAVVKTVYLPNLTAKSDITWITVDLLLWNSAEANTVIIAACIPCLRPMLLLVFERIKKISKKSEYVRHGSLELSGSANKGLENKIVSGGQRKLPGYADWESGRDFEANGQASNRINRVIEIQVELEDGEDTSRLSA